MRKRLFYGIFLFVLLLSGCSSAFDPATAFKNESMKQLFDEGETNLKAGYYRDAIEHYETLQARYPFGEYTETADLHIIYAYYKNSDDANALAAAQRFIHIHPASRHVDYAYYMRALTDKELTMGHLGRYFPIDYAERDLAHIKKSFLDFSELVHRFPKSRYTPDAKLQMVYLRNLLALHELQVAEFYMTRKAYVAAANRANIVVRHFQQTPYVPKALEIMIEAYRHLGETSLAEDARLVYRYNRYQPKSAA